MKLWIHGLVSAAITGIGTAVVASCAAPKSVNFSHDGLIAMAQIMGWGALVGVGGYFAKSPLFPTDSK